MSRLKDVTSYLKETMCYFMDFKLIGLIEFNDPATTLERYCGFLECNDLAERVSLGSRKERFGTTWRITVSDCVFGNSCESLRAERFMCPAALFAGFLVQESCSGKVRLGMSRLTLVGCETAISIWNEVLKPETIIISG